MIPNSSLMQTQSGVYHNDHVIKFCSRHLTILI